MKKREENKEPFFNRRDITILAAIFIPITIFAAIVIPPTRTGPWRSPPTACVNNLRQIDGAKQQWAYETKAATNATPTWKDLQPYIGRGSAGTIPKCLKGGVYSINSLTNAPTCSIPGHVLN